MKKKKIPFPQANNLETLYNLFFEIGPEGVTKEDIVGKYGLETDRQGDYYLNALLFIGLVEKYGLKFFLNSKGSRLRLESSKDIKKLFCKAILEQDFLSVIYRQSLCLEPEEKRMYVTNQIFNEFGLAASTAKRRADTICSWFDWIEQNLGEVN